MGSLFVTVSAQRGRFETPLGILDGDLFTAGCLDLVLVGCEARLQHALRTLHATTRTLRVVTYSVRK